MISLCFFPGFLARAYLFVGLLASGASAQPVTPPLRVLLIAGGCCHDYEAQKTILSEGLAARANVVVDIVHEGTTREHQLGLYRNPDWAKGYDVVIHDECFGYVDDNAFVESIASVHKAGVPAVMLHCSSHSYRRAETDAWRQLLGISSLRHDKRRDLEVKTVNPDHPVMKGLPRLWLVEDDELYNNVDVGPNVVPLAESFSVENQKSHVVIWVNTYGKARVFSMSLGHHNSTVASPWYLDLVARGVLWACGKLGPDGQPASGYAPRTP